MMRVAIDGDALLRRIDRLAQHSESPGGLTRTYLTEAHRGAAAQLAQWMSEAGMAVRRDAAGNVIGRYEARVPGAPAVLTGSHFDTVPNAGKYDGMLGVVLPIACVAEWHRQGRRFPFALEVIAFAEEEGVRFGATLLGSRAVAGSFDPGALDRRDDHGLSLRQALQAAGHPPELLPLAAFDKEDVLCFVEVHIEQGPVLLDENLPLGVVSAICGATRLIAAVDGRTGHSGTVPMALRRDAAMAAAEMALQVERRCSGLPGLVGTVGQLAIPNGAVNVVPGRAEFTIDIRAQEDAVRTAAVRDVTREMYGIAARRGVSLALSCTHEAASVHCAAPLQQQLAAAIRAHNLPVRHLPSGAGHDAMAMAALTGVAMLFVRCGNGGISHHPDEIVSAEDAALAATVFSEFVENFAYHP